MNDKIKTMISSDDPEIKALGYSILREDNPGVWAAMMSYTGMGNHTLSIIDDLRLQDHIINIGTLIRYRGMDNSPVMVVTEVSVEDSRTGSLSSKRYNTMLHAKYFNKSTQCFCAIVEKIQCFDIIKPKNKENES